MLKGQPQQVTSVGFNLDGRRILAQDWEGKILAWDTVTGNLVPDPPAQMPAGTPGNQPRWPPPGSHSERRGGGRAFHRPLLGRTSRTRGDGAAGTLRPGLHSGRLAEADSADDDFASAFHLGHLLRRQPWAADLLVKQRMCSPARDSPSRPLSALPAPCCSTPVSRSPTLVSLRAGNRAVQSGNWPRAVAILRVMAEQPGASRLLRSNLLLAELATGDVEAARRTAGTSLPRCPARGTPLSRPSCNPGCQQLSCPRRTPGSGSNTHARPSRAAQRLILAHPRRRPVSRRQARAGRQGAGRVDQDVWRRWCRGDLAVPGAGGAAAGSAR